MQGKVASRHLSVPSSTPPSTQSGSLSSQVSLMTPTPSQYTQASSYTSQLHAQADALARMTFELNIRAVSAQADRLEQDIQRLVLYTAEDKDFREKNESRLNELWHEIVAVKAHMVEVHSDQKHCEINRESCQKQLATLSEHVEAETTDLRAVIDSMVAKLDKLQSPMKFVQSHAVHEAPERLGVQTRAMTKGKGVDKAIRKAKEGIRGTRSSAETPGRALEAIRKRIQETISSTRRWNRDHKTTALDDGTFVANYLRQQSKRDPPMAVFIQKSIQRRIRRRLPRATAPPDSLETFCRNLRWQDVTETVEIVLVTNEANAVQALR